MPRPGNRSGVRKSEYTARARWVLEKGYADLVAFGRPYIANPDLAERLTCGWPLAVPDPDSLYGGDERGYLDYPVYSPSQEV